MKVKTLDGYLRTPIALNEKVYTTRGGIKYVMIDCIDEDGVYGAALLLTKAWRVREYLLQQEERES